MAGSNPGTGRKGANPRLRPALVASGVNGYGGRWIRLALTLSLAIAATFALAPDAQARPVTPAPLVSVQNAVAATHHWQRLGGFCCKPYGWVAHQRSTPTEQRWRIAGRWWGFARMAHHRYAAQPRSLVPGWFVSALACIGRLEEGGGNSTAGMYGFIYSPGSYGPVDQALVRVYGYSWLNWPKVAQDRVAWMLYGMYGWSPWSTSDNCGLA